VSKSLGKGEDLHETMAANSGGHRERVADEECRQLLSHSAGVLHLQQVRCAGKNERLGTESINGSSRIAGTVKLYSVSHEYS
jgi:hypothetical protein